MSNYPKYNSHFLGIVVNNSDPDQAGKVQVFVPHISVNIYKNWNELPQDRKFKFIGKNIQSDLSDILDDLRKILPWAVQANPLASESSKGRYSEYLKSGTISDSNKLTTFVDNTSASSPTNKITTYSQNLDNIGEKAGYRYDLDKFRLTDAFSDSSNHTTNVNKFSHNYIPETLSNCAKGIFSIPSVGSHVWCFFLNGDPMRPVYFAASFGKEDWHGIYECSDTEHGLDYPGSFETSSLSGRDINAETYRNKFVINQKGGNIQIVNSDNRECLKFTHFSGSFKEFNNYTNIELASKNDQKLVLGDSFYSHRGSLNIAVEKEFDQIIRGDYYKKIGNLNDSIISQWKSIVSNIADIKQLFETRRSQSLNTGLLKSTSSRQTRNGQFGDCPVCKGSKVLYYKINDIFNSTTTAITNLSQDGPYLNGCVSPVGTQPSAQLGTFGSSGLIFSDICPSCSGSGKSTSSQNGNWKKETEKDKLNQTISKQLVTLARLEEQMGMGGSEIIDITKHKYETIGLVMNDFGSIRVDSVGKIDNSSVNVATRGVFTNQTTTPLLEYVQVDDLPGGTYNLNVCNKYSILVGAGGLVIKTYGNINISGNIVNVTGEQLNLASSNEVTIDGGKRLNLVGDIISLKQRQNKQVLVDSSLGVNNNLVVGGGTHIEGELSINHITAPTEIQQTEQNTLYSRAVPGAIIGYGTALTTNIGGSNSIIGRTRSDTIIGYVTVPTHGTIPVYGADTNCINGAGIGVGGTDLTTLPIVVYGTGRDENSILAYPHSHNFRNLPLTLTKSNDETRKRGKKNNNKERNAADPVSHKKK